MSNINEGPNDIPVAMPVQEIKAAKARIAELEAELDKKAERSFDYYYDRIDELKKHLAELKTALKPILAAGENWIRGTASNDVRLEVLAVYDGPFTVGDLRALRGCLPSEEKP